MPKDKTVHSRDPACISLAFASGELEVRSALGRLKRGLAPMQLAEADESSVELVLGEVLNNVVEHAYGPDASGRILMECTPRHGALHFCVHDCGRALPGLRLPDGRPPDVERPLDDLPEGGFGWFLVHSLVESLAYRRDPEGNVLEFSIPLSQPGGAG